VASQASDLHRRPRADEGADEAVERQAADGELVLLGWRKAWNHEAVTDVHAEPVAGAPARGMAVEPGPQPLGHDPPPALTSWSSAVMARPLMPTYSSRSPSQTV
jgi:hypothetical protein